MEYPLSEHRDKFCSWVASRAASAPGCRFKVAQGQKLISAVGLRNLIDDPSRLPGPRFMDEEHWRWRDDIIREAGKGRWELPHGVAAKLINVYLKAGLVVGGPAEDGPLAALHPPVDRTLLEGLAKNDVNGWKRFWSRMARFGWSKWDSDQYMEVINAIRSAVNGEPLWKIEYYWPGSQGRRQ